MIQLQSVSESLFTLIICTGFIGISSDFSDESVVKIPRHQIIWAFYYTRSRVTDSPSFTDFLFISSRSAAETPETRTNRC
ncbi:hypothetical protein PO909_028053, partial [Leuciscus waleckii]